ncbi:MAG: type II secretion system protein GspM [Pseudomonadota bacterium]
MISAFENLDTRERLILGLGGLIAALVLLFLLVVEPLLENHQQTRQRLAQLSGEQAWLEAHADQVAAARPREDRQPVTAQANGGSLLGIVDLSARRADVHASMRQARPRDNGVQARFEGVDFQNLMGWLGSLEHDQQIVPRQLDITRTNEPGRVNAELHLVPGGNDGA